MRDSIAIQHLVQDHKYSEARFAALESLFDAIQAGGDWDAHRMQEFESFAEYFRADLLVHMRKEDEVLYPALEEFLPRDVGPLMVLRTEHDDICANFTRMEKAYELLLQGTVGHEVAQKFLFFGRTLLQLLRDHAYKEERVLFPMVARFLRPELDAHLASDMETLERCTRENQAANRPI